MVTSLPPTLVVRGARFEAIPSRHRGAGFASVFTVGTREAAELKMSESEGDILPGEIVLGNCNLPIFFVVRQFGAHEPCRWREKGLWAAPPGWIILRD